MYLWPLRLSHPLWFLQTQRPAYWPCPLTFCRSCVLQGLRAYPMRCYFHPWSLIHWSLWFCTSVWFMLMSMKSDSGTYWQSSTSWMKTTWNPSSGTTAYIGNSGCSPWGFLSLISPAWSQHAFPSFPDSSCRLNQPPISFFPANITLHDRSGFILYP